MDESRTTRLAGSIRRTPATWFHEMTNAARLLMAGKTALAAALAWWLAPLLPITDDQYSYYAPLGVLVSMYPTVAGSARSGFQALIGLALGIGLGLLGVAATFAGLPAVVTIALVIAIGVLVGGIRRLGEGRSWVAIAALFVLLLSGGDVEDFSLSYLLTMAFGVVVGVVINFAIVPPLYLGSASTRLSALRDTLSALMRRMADQVEQGEMDADGFDAELARLDQTTADVRDEVQEADESRRANPRGRRHRSQQEENLLRLQALERTAFYTREFAGVLIGLEHTDDLSLHADARVEFAAAIRACGDLVATPVYAEGSRDRLEAANTALDAYRAALHRASVGSAPSAADELTPAAFLRRIIDVSRPFTDAAGP